MALSETTRKELMTPLAQTDAARLAMSVGGWAELRKATFEQLDAARGKALRQVADAEAALADFDAHRLKQADPAARAAARRRYEQDLRAAIGYARLLLHCWNARRLGKEPYRW